MGYGGLSQYFSSLLGLEVAVFGVTSATIFVFIQIAFGKLHTQDASRLFRNRWMVLFLLSATSLVLATQASALLFSLPAHDFIPRYNLNTRAILSRHWFIALCSFAWLIPMLFAARFFLVSGPLFYAAGVLRMEEKELDIKRLRRFLLSKYGIDEPRMVSVPFAFGMGEDDLKREVEAFERAAKEAVQNGTQIDIGDHPSSAALIRVETEARKRHERAMDEYNNAVQGIRGAEDPMLNIKRLGAEAVAKNDFYVLNLFFEILHQLSRRVLSTGSKRADWSIDKQIPIRYIREVRGILQVQLEMTDRHGLESARLMVTDFAEKLMRLAIEHNEHEAIRELNAFYSWAADRYCDDKRLLANVIRSYPVAIEVALLMQEGVGHSEKVDELCRGLGWLGERVLIDNGDEKMPLMPNAEDASLLDGLMNAVDSVADLYANQHPKKYPLIFFDAIDVIFLRLISQSDRNEDLRFMRPGFTDRIFNLMFAYYRFGLEACRVGNGNGVRLSALRLNMSLRKIDEVARDSENRKEVVRLLLSIGAMAGAYEESFEADSGWMPSIPDYVVDAVAPFMDYREVQSDVLDVYLKTHEGDIKGKNRFIVSLSKKCSNDFGLRISQLRT